MPDFVDPPEIQHSPICSGSLRPKTNVQKHAHRYCVKASSQPNQCSSQPDRRDYSNLPHSLETLGIAALRGNPLWNAKPETVDRARQPQSSDALAPNDANHAIVERLKSPENYHIERENVLHQDTVDDTIAKRLIILENFNTETNGKAWEELVQYAQSDSTEAHQVMQSVVDYVIKELHKLESQGDRKEAAVRYIHASDKYGEDEAAVAQDKDKLLWLKERVSKWLLGLSKLYQDPAFAALAFQGTHYAGLEGTVIDEQTGHPIRVPNEAQAIQSKKSADSFAKTGNMSNLYRTGAVCNEFAYASSSIANPTGTKNAFPVSISKSNWYSPALVEQERYKTTFDDIEQGDAIVALNPRQNDKSRKNDNPPSLEELSKYTGRHVDIVVAVSKRTPPKKKKGNKADREQDEQPPQKAVMLAGARGSDYPNGIHSSNNKTKWYFRDDDKFKQPFIVIKSIRKHHSIDLSTALTQDFKYESVKSDIAYNINSKHLNPHPNMAIIHHSSNSNHICLGDNELGYNNLVDVMEDVPSNKRSSHYVDDKSIEVLTEFKKSLDAITNNEQRTFIFEHLRNNIHSKVIEYDIKDKSVSRKSLSNHVTATEMSEINTILDNRSINESGFIRIILIYRTLPTNIRDTIVKGFSSPSSMSFNACPIHSSSVSSESKRQIATKSIWRSKHP